MSNNLNIELIIKNKKDRHNRNLINKNYESFSIYDNGVYIDKTWEDLSDYICTNQERDKYITKYSQGQVKLIFDALYRADQKYADARMRVYGDALADLKNKAVEKALKKYTKNNETKICGIVLFDSSTGIGKNNEPIFAQDMITLIEQETENSIVVLDELLYNSNWFKQLKLHNVELRIFTYSKKTINNVNTYTNNIDILRKHPEDKREIYMLGGEHLFKLLCERLNALWFGYLEEYSEDNTDYFTELNWNVWGVDDVYNNCKLDNNKKFTITKLFLLKTRKQEWKESKLKHYIESKRGL